MSIFERYIGVDYLGARMSTASLKGLRVNMERFLIKVRAQLHRYLPCHLAFGEGTGRICAHFSTSIDGHCSQCLSIYSDYFAIYDLYIVK